MNVEEAAKEVVHCAFRIHRDLGPGLLESVYETVLFSLLEQRGLVVERQKSVTFNYSGITFTGGLRVDLLVERQLVLELKSVEVQLPVHSKQVLTYLRLMRLPLGLLINFGAPNFRECVRRVVNNHKDAASSTLRIHNG
jgi:iron complex transport system substrate-binding protein